MTDTTMTESITPDAIETTEPPGRSAGRAHAATGDVRADRVEISQGGANTVEAHTVSIQQGGAGRVRATDLSVNQGGVAIARTDRLEVGEGGGALAVIADRASIQPGGRVLLLLARTAEGDVRPLLDIRSAAALGAGVLLAALLLRGRG